MGMPDRTHFNFETKVRRAFAFLEELGFAEIEALPTLVRYRKEGIEVDVYHGRQSYEVGAGVTAFGARYPISAIIRATDSQAFKQFRYATVSTSEGVTSALEELSSLMKRYGTAALRGTPKFFSMLEEQQKLWSEEYALDVLARQLWTQADEAFRRGDYSMAADLYARIRARLSPAEVKKLALAEERCKR